MNSDGLGTQLVHWDGHRDPHNRPVVNPIYLSTTYSQAGAPPSVGQPFSYSRTSNPNRTDIEGIIGQLEGGYACLFASGMAAVHGVFQSVCAAGSHVVLPADAYAGTLRLVVEELTRLGITHTLVDMADLDAVENSITAATTLLWVENPTNPTLKSVDVPQIVALKRRALVAVDNTLATPIYQRPLELGADFSVHSTSKYMSGHSDVVGGAVATSNASLADRLHTVQNSFGSVPSPFDCFLTGRGIKTLHLRMAAHTRSGAAVAAFLGTVPGISDVHWPGYGGMISFRCTQGRRLADTLRLFYSATSLGGVESLIKIPWSMSGSQMGATHKSYPADTVRLSCGIEDPKIWSGISTEV